MTQAVTGLAVNLSHTGCRFAFSTIENQSGGQVWSFSGNIIVPERMGQIAEIQLRLGTEVLALCKVQGRNPRWAESNGADKDCLVRFTGRILAADLPGRFTLDVSVKTVADDKNRVTPIATLQGQRPSGVLRSVEPISPLLVTSAGRSGSTLMMRILTEHPEVVAPAYYPFETRILTYFWRSFQVTSRPADHGYSMGPDAFEAAHTHIGYNPYFSDIYTNRMPDPGLAEWFSGDAVIMASQHAKAMTNAYGAALCKSFNRPDAKFIAEKILPVSLVNQIVENYAGTKEIFLVRDCRDAMLSAWNFNIKRGTLSFNMEGNSLDEEIKRQSSGTRQLAQSYSDRADHCLLVKYEDLMHDPLGEATRVFDYAGLSTNDVESIVSQAFGSDASQHMTSASAEESVARWKDELTKEQQRLAREHHKEFLETFGYV